MSRHVQEVIPSREQLRQAVAICRCLSDSIALRMCGLLKAKPRTIAEIQRELSLSRVQANERLRKLRECSLVEEDRSGRWLVFRLSKNSDPLFDILMSLEENHF